MKGQFEEQQHAGFLKTSIHYPNRRAIIVNSKSNNYGALIFRNTFQISWWCQRRGTPCFFFFFNKHLSFNAISCFLFFSGQYSGAVC